MIRKQIQQLMNMVQLTFWFHAHFQALAISTRLANITSLERNSAIAVAWTPILQTITFLHTTSEETLHIHIINY